MNWLREQPMSLTPAMAISRFWQTPASTGPVFCGFALLIQDKNEYKGIDAPKTANPILGE